MKSVYLRLFAFGLLAAFSQAQLFAQKAPGKYYVIANAGLNQRVGEATSSKKMMTVPYGTKVEILQKATSSNLTVDGLSGGMAKIKCNGTVGYMFDGYLVRFPAPTNGEKTEDYIAKLWEDELDAMKEEINRDYGGYYQSEDGLYISKISWGDAFLMAKNHFGIPATFKFPGEKGSGEKVVKNVNAHKEAWTDELTAKYEGGKLVDLYYSYRTDGSGSVIGVELSKNNGYKFRIYERLIAD